VKKIKICIQNGNFEEVACSVATSLQIYPNGCLVTWIKPKTGHFGHYNSDIELKNAI
jgi:hypothetical protein